MDPCQGLEVEWDHRETEPQVVLEAAALITCLSQVLHPLLVPPSAALDCTLRLLLALHSLLEAQGPINIFPLCSLLLLCPHHKDSLIQDKHRVSPTTQHHQSQKQRPTCLELIHPRMQKKMKKSSSLTTYYMPRAQLPINPSITNLPSNYPNPYHKQGMGKERD